MLKKGQVYCDNCDIHVKDALSVPIVMYDGVRYFCTLGCTAEWISNRIASEMMGKKRQKAMAEDDDEAA